MNLAEQKIAQAAAYVKYLARRSNAHDLHSPFAFELYNLMHDTTPFYAFELVESLRSSLLLNTKLIQVDDFGAGSQVATAPQRTIASIARHAAMPAAYAQMLFRICVKNNFKTALELGTSLGITTCYLAKTSTHMRVTTLEGCTNTAAVATHNFQKLACKNISLINAPFDTALPEVLNSFDSIDMVLIDGNHRYAPTMAYARACIPKLHNDSVLVIDDIHWSAEMEQAWADIQELDEVMMTVDLFRMGLVFFKKELTKQHFVFKF